MTQAPLEFSSVAGVAQSPNLRGSQTLAATLKPSPLLGYWFGVLARDYGKEGKAARTRALKAIADYGADLADTMLSAAYDAFGFTKAGPVERLAFYENDKTPQDWAEQQAKYPADWEEDWTDYQRLLRLAAEGRLIEG